VTRRLVLAFVAVTAAVVVVLVVPLGSVNARRLLEDVRSGVLRDAYALGSFAAEALGSGGDTAPLARVAEAYTARTGARVVVVDAEGWGVVDTDPPAPGERDFSNRPEVAEALAGRVATGTRRSRTLGSEFVYVAVPVASGTRIDGAVRITYPTDAVDGRIRRNWMALAGVSLVSLLVAAGAGLVLARWVARPVTALSDVAEDLGAGQLGTRADEQSGPPEVRSLAADVNRMAGRLERLVTSQQDFVADASHQLRSPLAALRLRLENAEAELAVDPAEAAQDLAAAQHEVDRLARLVDGLLVLARADRDPGDPRPQPLAPLLTDRAQAWGAVAGERGVVLEVHADPAVSARLDGDRLAQVLDNLLANALAAAPPGTTVSLVAEQVGTEVLVGVRDEGPGMSEEERARAFDRFWRASGAPSGARSLGGSGLGLAIVARLAAADGGRASLHGVQPHGLEARVRYPAAV
jgi:signal transduction histidine kinase